MAESNKRSISVDRIPGPDFTLYRYAEGHAPDPNEEPHAPRDKVLKNEDLPTDCFKDADGKNRYSCAPPLLIECKGKLTESRALACLAYRGRFWSVTVRSGGRNAWDAEGEYLERLKEKLRAYVERREERGVKFRDSLKLEHFLGYWPKGYDEGYSEHLSKASPPRKGGRAAKGKGGKGAGDKDGEVFLNDIYTLCGALDEVLFEQAEAPSHPSGLVVITGATDSSKSLITRGLIFLHLERAASLAAKEKRRRPHLVTFEDPIEKYYVLNPLAGKAGPSAAPVSDRLSLEDLEELLDALYLDYTPRERNVDADSLKHVIEDALRQTPAVLFVGETREKEDWKDLLQFAGTGHLVVTTSHAKSVVEAMSDIFRETETKTQAQRSEIARRILGVVNVRKFTPRDSNVRALLPAMWKSTPNSISNLVADGLASILPAQERESIIGYYGRKYFAQRLTAKSPLMEEAETADESRKEEIRNAIDAIKKKANEWDFEGV